ncbi:proteasome subunit [Coccomyxa subellipsoidea C-169]|uniref:Proteasome subunit beta n=1 Tax=Coccomyxa subellipsoidea (strain C-169) TaxID=574566 RepID=I0YXZ2_COCSC|nr:proteasome subunit [Coccomyxa subellipsoidea C-169]EIE23261.1 proteasome subunit [Coccomyxa subellipsoidea C-169]|eukprot:XP_005647805.1 proteasome subunit [Coccomyxa subellipsoidea C-169]
MSQLLGDEAPHTGTTIVAVSFDGGVVLGADSRVSTGNYVSNRASDKITSLSDNAYMLRSGSAADTQAIADYVRHYTAMHSMELGRDPKIKSVAKLVAQINYSNKNLLMGAMIVGGWDPEGGGQIFGVPISGTLVQQDWTTDGSGSTYIWGYLDSAYRDGMSREEAEELVKTALALAMSRDGSSGGLARLITITKAGAERRMIKGDEIPLFWDEIEPMGTNGTGMVVV